MAADRTARAQALLETNGQILKRMQTICVEGVLVICQYNFYAIDI